MLILRSNLRKYAFWQIQVGTSVIPLFDMIWTGGYVYFDWTIYF